MRHLSLEIIFGAMDRPLSLVFVHGSWHRPTCYDKVIKILNREHGLECTAVTLPSNLGNRAATFKDDLDAARAAIVSATTNGHNVLVIAHSYGGMVANSAIKDLTLQDGLDGKDLASTTFGHVIGLILISSGFTLTGLAFMDPFFGHPPPSWRVNASTGFAELVTPPSMLFYHDLPPEEAAFWVSELMPQSLKALFEGGEHSYAGWMDVPTWYIGTIQAKALPVFAQRLQVGMARQMGGTVEHRELATSHSPFLSKPEDVVAIVLDAVTALKGKLGQARSLESDDIQRRQRKKGIVVASVKLWQPRSWFKFGFPYALGRGIGALIMMWTWGRRLWRS